MAIGKDANDQSFNTSYVKVQRDSSVAVVRSI